MTSENRFRFLVVLALSCVAHGAWEYFSGELNALLFVLSLSGQPWAGTFRIAFAMPVVQTLSAGVAVWRRNTRVLPVAVLVAVGATVVLQVFVVAAHVTLWLDPKAKIRGPAVLLSPVLLAVWIGAFGFALREAVRREEPDEAKPRPPLNARSTCAPSARPSRSSTPDPPSPPGAD